MTILTASVPQRSFRLTLRASRQAELQPDPSLPASLSKTKDLLDELLVNLRRLEALLEQVQSDRPKNQD